MLDFNYIARLRRRLDEVENEMANPELVAQPHRYQTLVAEHARLNRISEQADFCATLQQQEKENIALLDDKAIDEELAALAEEDLAKIRQELPAAERALQMLLLPRRPEDSRNTIIEIRAGTGGEEAALFAADLFRLYSRFAEKKGWKIGIMDMSSSPIGGVKEIIFSVEGEDVYRLLRYESGVHRVQRIPVTEASGRIHTSAATVAVMPEAEDIEVVIRPEDLRVDVYRSSGPGGQKVNRTDSAVRLTHLPTGLVVQCQDEKSQHRNREKAMRVLRARLLDLKQTEEAQRQADTRRSQVGSGDRSQRIRTYNFPQNRITEHRLHVTFYNLDRVMEGELDELLEALVVHDAQERLQHEIRAEA